MERREPRGEAKPSGGATSGSAGGAASGQQRPSTGRSGLKSELRGKTYAEGQARLATTPMPGDPDMRGCGTLERRAAAAPAPSGGQREGKATPAAGIDGAQCTQLPDMSEDPQATADPAAVPEVPVEPVVPATDEDKNEIFDAVAGLLQARLSGITALDRVLHEKTGPTLLEAVMSTVLETVLVASTGFIGNFVKETLALGVTDAFRKAQAGTVGDAIKKGLELGSKNGYAVLNAGNKGHHGPAPSGRPDPDGVAAKVGAAGANAEVPPSFGDSVSEYIHRQRQALGDAFITAGEVKNDVWRAVKHDSILAQAMYESLQGLKERATNAQFHASLDGWVRYVAAVAHPTKPGVGSGPQGEDVSGAALDLDGSPDGILRVVLSQSQQPGRPLYAGRIELDGVEAAVRRNLRGRATLGDIDAPKVVVGDITAYSNFETDELFDAEFEAGRDRGGTLALEHDEGGARWLKAHARGGLMKGIDAVPDSEVERGARKLMDDIQSISPRTIEE